MAWHAWPEAVTGFHGGHCPLYAFTVQALEHLGSGGRAVGNLPTNAVSCQAWGCHAGRSRSEEVVLHLPGQ